MEAWLLLVIVGVLGFVLGAKDHVPTVLLIYIAFEVFHLRSFSVCVNYTANLPICQPKNNPSVTRVIRELAQLSQANQRFYR